MPESGGVTLGLRAQAKAEVFRRIREAAGALLADRGFDQITTREVAQRAGIGEATLFRYVSSKDELLTLVYGDQMDVLIETLLVADDAAAFVEGSADGMLLCARVKALYRGRSDFYLAHPTNASRYLRQAFEIASPNRARTMAQGDRFIARVTEILQAGQSQAVINGDVDASVVAQNCHGIFIHEVDRTATREYPPETIWQRVSARLDAQLLVLVIDPARS